MEIKVGVVGATGYAGAELVRLLLNHPYAKLTAISSVTFEGQKISEVYPSYLGLCDMVCKTQEEVVENATLYLQHCRMDYLKNWQQPVPNV